MAQEKILIELDEWMDEKRESHSAPEQTKPEKGSSPMEEAEKFNPVNPHKQKEEFRNYKNSARQTRVERLYRRQHEKQTYEFVQSMEKKWLSKFQLPREDEKASGVRMGVWEGLEYLDSMVDDSDPDTNFSQVMHALQTAEAIRKKWPDEEWFQVTGLIHDLGKIMAISDPKLGLPGEPQWAVVGDTFPVGMPFSEKIVFSESFDANKDVKDPKYSSGLGIYKPQCGLFNVKMCWGHDEYMYQVCVNNGCKLPLAALYIIRYHSFYAWHQAGAYSEILNEEDKEMLKWIKEFNQFDLYSKADVPPDVAVLKPYYQQLLRKYFPDKLLW